MNENLFEYSDMLRSPIEAFCCGTGYWEGPVSSNAIKPVVRSFVR